MLRSEAILRIQDGLGFRTDLVDKIISRLKEEQRSQEMGRTLPWFLIEEDATLTLAAAANTVALPANFLRPLDIEPMRYTVSGSTTPRYVTRKDFDKAISAYGSSDAAGPQVYALRTNSLYFFPTAAEEYTLTWSYYKHDVVLDTEIENLWLEHAPEVLIGGAGTRIALDARDKDAISIFSEMYKAASSSLFRETVAREEAAQKRRKGSG